MRPKIFSTRSETRRNSLNYSRRQRKTRPTGGIGDSQNSGRCEERGGAFGPTCEAPSSLLWMPPLPAAIPLLQILTRTPPPPPPPPGPASALTPEEPRSPPGVFARPRNGVLSPPAEDRPEDTEQGGGESRLHGGAAEESSAWIEQGMDAIRGTDGGREER